MPEGRALDTGSCTTAEKKLAKRVLRVTTRTGNLGDVDPACPFVVAASL
jgi:hypothetical protein